MRIILQLYSYFLNVWNCIEIAISVETNTQFLRLWSYLILIFLQIGFSLQWVVTHKDENHGGYGCNGVWGWGLQGYNNQFIKILFINLSWGL